jgi:hypothetical protein
MSRPGDVYHPDFDQGHPTYFDISVRNSLQASYIIQAAVMQVLQPKQVSLRRIITTTHQ